MESLVPPYLQKRKQDEERLRKQQRIDYAMKTIPSSSTQVANDNITYKKGHAKSMMDALKEVRRSKHTIPDGLHMRPENHKGFY